MTAEVVDMFATSKPQKDDVPDWLAEDWADFLESRRQIKKPMTEVAKRRMLAKLRRCEQTHGREVVAQMLEDSMIKGWQDVYPENYATLGARSAEPARQTVKVTRADLERHARPGESYEQVEARLKRERGLA